MPSGKRRLRFQMILMRKSVSHMFSSLFDDRNPSFTALEIVCFAHNHIICPRNRFTNFGFSDKRFQSCKFSFPALEIVSPPSTGGTFSPPSKSHGGDNFYIIMIFPPVKIQSHQNLDIHKRS